MGGHWAKRYPRSATTSRSHGLDWHPGRRVDKSKQVAAASLEVSPVGFKNIEDGASHTILLAEKAVTAR